jgi:PleD family two-component response regulator
MARAIEAAATGIIYDEDEAAGFMREMFAERMEQTRALLNIESQGADEGKLKAAAGALKDESPPETHNSHGAASSEPRTAMVSEEPAEIQTRKFKGGRSMDPTSAGGRVRVLAVASKSKVLADIQKALHDAGYSVATSKDAADATLRLERDAPALVVTAIALSDESGFELCRRVRQTQRDRYIPVILLSSVSALEERVEGIAAGADDFLKEAFEPEELIARIKAHLLRAASMGPRKPKA